jgi:hypothetical protein
MHAKCAFECASGYSASSSMLESYISAVGFMIPTPIETFYLERPPTCEFAVGLQGEMFCFQNSALVHMRTGNTVAADIGQRLEIEDYRYDIRITAATAAGADTMWVAFSFSGVCGLFQDIDAECGAIELITVSLDSVSISSAAWGKTFPWTGLVGRITAMSYLPQQLFLVIDKTSVKMYRVAFYDSSIKFEARMEDALVDYYESRDIIHDVAACGSASAAALYAIAGDGRLIQLPGALLALTLPPQAAMLICVAADILIVTTSDKKWMQVDLVNKIVGTQSPATAVAFSAAAQSVGILHVLADNALNVFAATPCPRDHFFHDAACVPMPCILACGPNSTRAMGRQCECLPGFFITPSGCAPCEARHICPGGSAPPRRCDATTEVVHENKCICAPGYYRYDSCLPCPSNHWCYREKVVPCLSWAGWGESNPRSSSPIDCSCPPRTHGVQCLPCDADADCSAPATVAVDVWIFDRAADAAIVAATPGAAASADAHVVVTPVSSAASVSSVFIRLHPSRSVRTRQMVPCGRNSAWLFDACSCVAGYEPPQCLPCLNGTARSLLQQACTPCANGSSAPYLGMEACLVVAAEYNGVTPLCILLTTVAGVALVLFGVLMGAFYH